MATTLYPTITFQVNLQPTGSLGGINSVEPDATTTDGNQIATDESNIANTRSTFIPGLTGIYNRAYKQGEQFTVSGKTAYYLYNNYCSIPMNINDLLYVVSSNITSSATRSRQLT